MQTVRQAARAVEGDEERRNHRQRRWQSDGDVALTEEFAGQIHNDDSRPAAGNRRRDEAHPGASSNPGSRAMWTVKTSSNHSRRCDRNVQAGRKIEDGKRAGGEIAR